VDGRRPPGHLLTRDEARRGARLRNRRRLFRLRKGAAQDGRIGGRQAQGDRQPPPIGVVCAEDKASAIAATIKEHNIRPADQKRLRGSGREGTGPILRRTPTGLTVVSQFEIDFPADERRGRSLFFAFSASAFVPTSDLHRNPNKLREISHERQRLAARSPSLS
jgi:hypothetical protein